MAWRGESCFGELRLGESRRRVAGLVCHGVSGLGAAWWAGVRHGRRGEAWRGAVMFGLFRQGGARCGRRGNQQQKGEKTMVYQWSIGLYASVDANDAGAELERIEKENGEITSQAVVDAARSKKNVLHGLFEWDDKIAGEKWRLNQARCMIAALVVVPEEDKSYDKRAYVNIVKRSDNKQEQARYINYESAMSDEEMRATLLENAKEELRIFREKYKTLSELAAVFEAIDKAVGKGAA